MDKNKNSSKCDTAFIYVKREKNKIHLRLDYSEAVLTVKEAKEVINLIKQAILDT